MKRQRTVLLSFGVYVILRLCVCIVVEVSLYVNDRRTLVAAARCQVAQRTDEIRQPSRRRSLGYHAADQVGILMLDIFRNRLFQLVTA